MTAVKDDRPDHVLALVGYVLEGFRSDLVNALSGSGAKRVPPPARGLRPSQIRMLSLTPVDGMRVTDLAERVGMTKQALGEFANDLERQGLLETVRDPTDRRVRILRPTRRGRRAVEAAEAVIGEVEGRWRTRMGPRKWEQLRRLLAEAADLGTD